MTPSVTSYLERFRESPPDLIEKQSDERLGTADVRRWYDDVERYRILGIDQVGDAPVTSRRDFCNRRITVEAQETHRGGEDTREFVLALVQQFARCRCDDGMGAV